MWLLLASLLVVPFIRVDLDGSRHSAESVKIHASGIILDVWQALLQLVLGFLRN